MGAFKFAMYMWHEWVGMKEVVAEQQALDN